MTQIKFIVSLLFGALVFVGCSNNKAQNQQSRPPQKLEVVEVPIKTVNDFQEYPVRIEGTNNNDVRAKISGYIQSVYVDEGQQVQKGQRLFRLETHVLSQQANAAKSSVQSAQAAIESARAAVNSAQVEVDRLKPLVEKNIISPVQLETAKAKLASARAGLAQAESAKKQAKSSLNSIQANINYSIVRAPISGIVGSIDKREGSLVGPADQKPITTVSQIDNIYAYFSMNESQYLNFLAQTPGATLNEKFKNIPEVSLILANGTEYPQKGEIETMTGQINPTTGTIQFRATFPNSNHLLTNGNSGTIQIPKTYTDVLVIPLTATSELQEIVSVFKVEQDSVVSTTITLKDKIDNLGIVEKGLQEGDIIVVKDSPGLQPGTKIQPQLVEFDSIIHIQPIFN